MPPDSNREAWPGTWAMVPLGPAARAPSPSVPHCRPCLAVLTRPASSGPSPRGVAAGGGGVCSRQSGRSGAPTGSRPETEEREP